MALKVTPQEDDDFTFGELTTGKTAPEETEADTGEEAKEEEAKTGEQVDIKAEAEKKEEEKKEEEKKPEADKKTEEASQEAQEENTDIFAETDETKEEKKISLKKIAKDLDVELEKEDDEEEFKSKFSEKLEKSKQEFKLDGYSDSAKAIIKHLNENGGDIESFFQNNQIAAMQSVLALDPETKVRNVRLQEVISSGVTKEEAIKQVDEEIKTWGLREIKDAAADIDDQAKKLINDEVKKIVGDQEMKAVAERQRREQQMIIERTNLKAFIDKQDNFLGLGLTPEAKKLILRDIDNGTFDKVLNQNPESVKFSSYMFSKYGAKIMKKISDSLSETNRKGYNAATRKALDALHKTEETAGTAKTGHASQKKESSEGNKPKWSSEDFE